MEKIKQDTLKNMVEFAAGSFEMGNPGYYGFDSADTRPRHTVTLDTFAMMAYKVSYDDFDVFTDSVGEQRVDMDDFRVEYRAPRKPVGVSWYGAKAYCLWLGKLTGKAFDLPTEAQWEYAARSGGKDVLFATDNGKIDEGRNYPSDEQIEASDKSKPLNSLDSILATPDLGSFPANPAGLYGMIDYNSTEWVQDWYNPHYYEHSPTKNPTGGTEQDSINAEHPERGSRKVTRGLQSANPDMSGYVFTRGYHSQKMFSVVNKRPLVGYTANPSYQFRCVLNPR
jgi:formylglycine-generating enzyme required for sulfatase activity